MYPRTLKKTLLQTLKKQPAVALLGARAVGKTTLAMELSQEVPSIYLDLTEPEDLLKIRSMPHYFEAHKHKLIILDEIQRYPHLLEPLRNVIYRGSREGLKYGRFLVLGSASKKLKKYSADLLAGRVAYLQLAGLTPLETSALYGEDLLKLWFRGGFPESYDAKNHHESHEWRRHLITTYLNRDIPQLQPTLPTHTLTRLWTLLAHHQGALWNPTKIAAPLSLPSAVVEHYIHTMQDLLLLRSLQPWHENVKKQVVRAPKIYIRDSGLLHALMNITDPKILKQHTIMGNSWEGFVIEQIISSLPSSLLPYFYRTTSGDEIDLLLVYNLSDFWALEIKAATAPKVKKGFHNACEDLSIKRKFVIYNGKKTYSLEQGTTAISLAGFIKLIQKEFENTLL